MHKKDEYWTSESDIQKLSVVNGFKDFLTHNNNSIEADPCIYAQMKLVIEQTKKRKKLSNCAMPHLSQKEARDLYGFPRKEIMLIIKKV